MVDRVEVLAESTVVSGHLINGSPFELRIGAGESLLVSSDGEQVRMLEEFPVTSVPPAGEIDLVLKFGPVLTDEPVELP